MYKRGDVVLVELPEAGGSVQTGRRLCVIVSNNTGNNFGPTLVVVPMTSKVFQKSKMPTHVVLDKSAFCFLKCDSLVLCEQLLTITKESVIKKVGHIQGSKMNRINTGLRIELSLG